MTDERDKLNRIEATIADNIDATDGDELADHLVVLLKAGMTGSDWMTWAIYFEHLAAIRGVRLGKRGGPRSADARDVPTVGELAREVGVSESTAYRRLGGYRAYLELDRITRRDLNISFSELVERVSTEADLGPTRARSCR